MTYTCILAERDGSSFIIRINRPERRNAISVLTMQELTAAFREAEADDAVRGVILTGSDQLFSAGADLNDALKVDSAAVGVAYFKKWHDLCNTVESLAKPVIAAIEGFCMTGGCELSLACDLRIAGQGASFAITSSRIGTVAGAGGTQRLPRLIGPSRALELLLSALPIDADEAYRIGLVNRLAPQGGSLAMAKSVVQSYEACAPLSHAFVKRAVHRGMQMDLASGLEFETFLVTTIYGSADKQEGISAFLEKRKPNFKGR